MRKLIAIAVISAAVAVANAQPHIVEIYPPQPNPPFGTNIAVVGRQLANKEFSIMASDAANFKDEFVGAFWACYHETQDIIAFFPFGPPFNFNFFRGKNVPCNDNLGPSPFFMIAMGLTPTERAWRKTINGVEYKLEPYGMIYHAEMSALVRLFRLVPTTTPPLL